ncbi:MAG TPA: lipopolysaccharide biosynthesis protein [Jatrophihabitans sp.]|nr:lipopolysaccharide biosynthesis protein [Jatrophihabitans sp.]
MRATETRVRPAKASYAVPPAEPAAGRTSRTHPSAGIAMLMIVGSGMLTQLLTTITGILSARMLGVEGRGQIVLVASLAMMASQLTLGGSLPNAVTKQLAERGVTARDGLRHLVMRWTRWALVPSAIAGGYFLIVEKSSHGVTKYTLAVIVLVMAMQTMMSRILAGAMLGEGADLIHIALTSVLPQAFVTAVLGVAFLAGVRWDAVQLSLVTATCIFIVLFSRLRLLKKPTRELSDQLDGHELFLLARRTHIGSVGPIDGLSIDRTLVGSLLGSAQLGLYSVAFALAGLTSILGGCLAMVILPRVAVAQRDPATERQLVRRWLLLSAGLIAAVVALLELMTHWVIRFAFGSEFLPATACAHWLLAAAGILDFRRVLIAVLQGRNRGGQASVIEIALTPLVVAGIVLAAVHHSLVGVSLAMAGAGVAGCLMLGVAVIRSASGARYEPVHALPRGGRGPARFANGQEPIRLAQLQAAAELQGML